MVRNGHGKRASATWHAILAFVLTYVMVMQLLYLPGYEPAYATEHVGEELVPTFAESPTAADTSPTETPDNESPDDDSAGAGDVGSGGTDTNKDDGTAASESDPATADKESAGAEKDATAANGSDDSRSTKNDTATDAREDHATDTTAGAEQETDPGASTDADASAPRTDYVLPTNLLDAASVVTLPNEGTYDVAQHLAPTLTITGAPQREGLSDVPDDQQPADRNAYLVGSSTQGAQTPATLTFDLGNTSARLAGGHVAGSSSHDALTITIDAPYYHYGLATADDAPAQGAQPTATLSQEEWFQAWGDAYGFRMAVRADQLPVGWVLYQQQGDAYFRVTEVALQQGVSGHLIARWEGNEGMVDAATPALVLQATLAESAHDTWGKVPTGYVASIAWGWEAHTYTTAPPRTAPRPRRQVTPAPAMPGA